jgi:hypothetical protein
MLDDRGGVGFVSKWEQLAAGGWHEGERQARQQKTRCKLLPRFTRGGFCFLYMSGNAPGENFWVDTTSAIAGAVQWRMVAFGDSPAVHKR